MKVTLAALLTSTLLTGAAYADEKVIPVVDGVLENLMQTRIAEEGLRQLGYDVGDEVQLQIQLAYTALAQGDATFYPAFAEPIHDQWIKENGGADNILTLGLLVPDNLQGYLIDKKTSDETGIKFLEDLKDPEKAKLFDIDGNGKADIFGCDPGWGCEKIIEHHLDAYGLRDTVEHKQGGYFAIIPDAIERVKEGKPTILYTWTPFWLPSILVPGKDVSWMNVHETSLPDGQTVGTEVEGLGNVGFPMIQQRIAVSTKFANANPSAKKFFELLSIPLADLNAQALSIYNGENSPEQINQAAMDWIAANQAQWDDWIAQAKAAQ